MYILYDTDTARRERQRESSMIPKLHCLRPSALHLCVEKGLQKGVPRNVVIASNGSWWQYKLSIGRKPCLRQTPA